MKRCPKCQILKELDQYYKNNTKRNSDGLSHYCKKCIKEYRVSTGRNTGIDSRQYIDKRWFIDYKFTLKCEKCGFSHPAALDFHHRDPKTKLFDISLTKITQSNQEKIFAEIAKCDVLCANCHRIEHSIIYNHIIEMQNKL